MKDGTGYSFGRVRDFDGENALLEMEGAGNDLLVPWWEIVSDDVNKRAEDALEAALADALCQEPFKQRNV